MSNLIKNSISALWFLKVVVTTLTGFMLLQSSSTTIRANGTEITIFLGVMYFVIAIIFLSVAYSNYKLHFKYTFIIASILGLFYLSFFIDQISLLVNGGLPALKYLYMYGVALFICIVTLVYSYAKKRSKINA